MQNNHSHLELFIWLACFIFYILFKLYVYNTADSKFAPSQWDTALLCNDVSHLLGASQDSAL